MKQVTSLDQTTATFLGTRWRLLGILLYGYIVMLLTLGIYRFWLVTRKRRFYWSNTQINGESLEYTGTATQLLVGFMLALVIFLPLYGFFFYLSTQSREAAIYGYSAAAIFMFFLSGYAAFRARRFLLTRTLWRGVRFSQSGNAWSYAFRRTLWVFATLATAGFLYPFMVTSLWRYRYNNTWFGNRKCEFNGSTRSIAGPFYFYYFVVVGLIITGLYLLGTSADNGEVTAKEIGEAPLAIAAFGAAATIAFFAYFHMKARITSRMLSSVSIGKAQLQVRVRAWWLFMQQFAYVIWIVLIAAVFLGLIGYVMGDVLEPLMQDRKAELGEVLQLGWVNLLTFGLIYLSFMATLAMIAELVFGLGYWRLVARGTVIENHTDLKTIRASGEESPLVGEGLADALNVGAY